MKNRNSLRSQSILVWKFYGVLYSRLFWCTKRKLVWPHNVFATNIVTSKHLFRTKTKILMLPFSEAAVRRCSAKKMFLKILQKIRKHLCQPLYFIKVAGHQKETLRHRCFPVNFVKCLEHLFYRTLPSYIRKNFYIRKWLL